MRIVIPQKCSSAKDFGQYSDIFVLHLYRKRNENTWDRYYIYIASNQTWINQNKQIYGGFQIGFTGNNMQ